MELSAVLAQKHLSNHIGRCLSTYIDTVAHELAA